MVYRKKLKNVRFSCYDLVHVYWGSCFFFINWKGSKCLEYMYYLTKICLCTMDTCRLQCSLMSHYSCYTPHAHHSLFALFEITNLRVQKICKWPLKQFVDVLLWIRPTTVYPVPLQFNFVNFSRVYDGNLPVNAANPYISD